MSCFCGNDPVIAKGMCRKCYDYNYLLEKRREEELRRLGPCKPRQANQRVTAFVRSLPLDTAQQVALGQALAPGVKKICQDYWGVGG